MASTLRMRTTICVLVKCIITILFIVKVKRAEWLRKLSDKALIDRARKSSTEYATSSARIFLKLCQ